MCKSFLIDLCIFQPVRKVIICHLRLFGLLWETYSAGKPLGSQVIKYDNGQSLFSQQVMLNEGIFYRTSLHTTGVSLPSVIRCFKIFTFKLSECIGLQIFKITFISYYNLVRFRKRSGLDFQFGNTSTQDNENTYQANKTA